MASFDFSSGSWCDAPILGFTCSAVSRPRVAAVALSAALPSCVSASAYGLGSDYADSGALAMAPWRAASLIHGEVNAHRRTNQTLPAYELRRSANAFLREGAPGVNPGAFYSWVQVAAAAASRPKLTVTTPHSGRPWQRRASGLATACAGFSSIARRASACFQKLDITSLRTAILFPKLVGAISNAVLTISARQVPLPPLWQFVTGPSPLGGQCGLARRA
jgi:hypothetical protein